MGLIEQARAWYGSNFRPSATNAAGFSRQASSTPTRFGADAYDAAGSGRRSKSWLVSNESVNSALFASAGTLRSKSRDQVRKNGIAANAVDTYETNCIGNGIKPQSQHPNELVRESIHKLWGQWVGEADADGTADFYGMQALVAREVFEAGECFLRERRRRAADGLSVPLQFQLIEPDFVPLEKTERSARGNRIQAGIETNGIGRRVAYHFHKEHPGDGLLLGGSFGTTRVRAEQVCHVYQLLRAGQLRGQPSLSPVLSKLYVLDLYDDAVVERAKVAALFAGFVHKNSDDDAVIAVKEQLTPTQAANEMVQGLAELEPGMLQVLLPGWDVTFSNPAEVGVNYEMFMKVQLHLVAAGIGITYEQLTGDLKGVNYSSIRAGLVHFRRRCEKMQNGLFVFQMCRPIWRRWMEAAVLSGALQRCVDSARTRRANGLLPLPEVNVLADYVANPEDYLAAEWRAPAWPWVDPLKDLQAEELAQKLRIRSRDETIKKLGRDPEVVDDEIAASEQRAQKKGIALPSVNGTSAAAPAPLLDERDEESEVSVQ